MKVTVSLRHGTEGSPRAGPIGAQYGEAGLHLR